MSNRAPRASAAAQHPHTARTPSSERWAGDGGEDAKHWPAVLTELKNRGVDDALMPVCDGLKGPSQAVEAVRPPHDRADLRDSPAGYSFRYAARQDWHKIARALKPFGEAPPPASSARKVRRRHSRLRSLRSSGLFAASLIYLHVLTERAVQPNGMNSSSCPRTRRPSKSILCG
ncbi:transposase [Nonomuraea wenchangensis]